MQCPRGIREVRAFGAQGREILSVGKVGDDESKKRTSDDILPVVC